MTNQQLQQQKIAPNLPVRFLQSFTSRRYGWWMRIGRPPQHYHPENVVVDNVEHDIHTWIADSLGLSKRTSYGKKYRSDVCVHHPPTIIPRTVKPRPRGHTSIRADGKFFIFLFFYFFASVWTGEK
jgi:hypothetical protein